jgi:hypothetical protein
MCARYILKWHIVEELEISLIVLTIIISFIERTLINSFFIIDYII